MNKLKKATKRITAVGASVLMVGSAAFGAGLSDYPSNFVKDGTFNGQVVVGATAAAVDSTSAASIIDDLKGEFSGNNEKVTISYKSTSSGGEEFKLADASSELNYGEYIGTARTQKVDNGDMNILADGTFKNGIDDQDYSQEVVFSSSNGRFEHSLNTNVNEQAISDNIYINDNVDFFTYTLDMDTPVDFSGDTTQAAIDSDMVGETIKILGSDYTITNFEVNTPGAGAGTLNRLELIGGANKVALGEGESSTTTINGKSYELSVASVASDKVLLSINGQSKSVDLYDTEDVSGVSVAVTDVVSSSRDSVKGYAEIVVGGQKITLENNKEVQINDEDISDFAPGYYAVTTFRGTAGTSAFDGFSISFQADNEMVLKAGDVFEDPIFNVLSVEFKGTNSPDYSVLKFEESGDQVDITGETIDGVSYSDALVASDQNYDGTPNYTLAGKDDNVNEDLMYVTGTAANLNLSTGDTKGVRFLTGDKDTQYMWEITSFDTFTNETDFDDKLSSSTNDNVAFDNWADLDGDITNPAGAVNDFNVTGFYDSFAFANQRMVNLSNVPAGGNNVTLSLDTDDTDSDNTGGDTENLVVKFTEDTTDNKANVVFFNSGSNVLTGFAGKADIADSNNDVKEYVTKYGSVIRVDAQDSEYVEVETPDEQVYANVYLTTGASSSSSSVTVDASAVDDKKAELEDKGYTITGTESSTTQEVGFDVTAPVLDSDVSGMDDMIVVGGPAVNSVAADLLGMSFPTMGAASGVGPDEAVVRYFSDSNSVLVYGYEGKDTAAAADKLNKGGLTGSLVNVG